ncbi:MAG: hypothetical protein L0216_15300 [Planctomycetales bacterium]|nr:hypothetical protein [Planctomycetales bacterium]
MRPMRALFPLAVAILAGCETEGRGILSSLTGTRERVDIEEARLPREDKEETSGWLRVVVGLPPHNREVGFIQEVAYTPRGHRDPILVRYLWPTSLHEPVGFVTSGGAAFRFPADGSPGAERFGRLPLETAALYILGACPKCGRTMDREVLAAQVRVDLLPKYADDYRNLIVAEHRRSRDLHPASGSYHPKTGGVEETDGVETEHPCEECRTSVPQLTGARASIPVTFERLDAAAFSPRPRTVFAGEGSEEAPAAGETPPPGEGAGG